MAKALGASDDSPGAIVKSLIERIPAGRVATYGTIGRAAVTAGRPVGGARTVAWILATLKAGAKTPWQRVVGAGGVILLPDQRGARQMSLLRKEGISFVKGKIPPAFLIDEIDLLMPRRSRRDAATTTKR